MSGHFQNYFRNQLSSKSIIVSLGKLLLIRLHNDKNQLNLLPVVRDDLP